MARITRIDETGAETEPALGFEWHGNTFVGRGLYAGLSLDGHDDAMKHVSQLHAILTWNARSSQWEVRDQGSANGTRLDGIGLPAGEPGPLVEGSVVEFGRTRWRVTDVAPPSPRARCVSTGEVRVARDGLLALPDEHDAEWRLIEGDFGWTWCARGEDIEEAATDLQVIRSGAQKVAGGRPWTIWLPSVEPSITRAPPSFDRLHVTIDISQDQETIEITCRMGSDVHRFGARRQHDLIWFLARARLEDEAAGKPPALAGWRSNDAASVGINLRRDDPYNYLNVLVHRARNQFKVTQVGEYKRAIERESGAGVMRIGLTGRQLRIINRGTGATR